MTAPAPRARNRGATADELLRTAPKLGEEIAGPRRGAAIGDAAGERPVGIARIGAVSASAQRREGGGDQWQRPGPFEPCREDRVGEPERQDLGIGPLHHDDPRRLRGGEGSGPGGGGELLHVGDRRAQDIVHFELQGFGGVADGLV